MNKHYQIIQYSRPVIFFLIILLISLFCIGCGPSGSDQGKSITSDAIIEKSEPVEINISFVGDIMAHMPQIDSARSGEDYDFSDTFKYIAPFIKGSDLAICNLETTFGDTPYSGYPLFSAPDVLAENIRDAGFDVAVTANNHMLDKGVDGLRRTIQITSDAGLKVTGTRSSAEDNDYLITEVNGINIGIIAYTFETPIVNGQRSINGIVMNDERKSLINSYCISEIEEDIKSIEKSITNAREDDADIIIVYFHWGEEYNTEPNENETDIARQVAGFGADIIFASHPHVLQGEDVIDTDSEYSSEDDDLTVTRTVPVFYSMGNFISNQRYDNNGNRRTEQGMIAQAKIIYDIDEKSIFSIDTGYVPTWVDKYYSANGNKYVIIPLYGDYVNNAALLESNHSGKAEEAYKDIEEILGTPKCVISPIEQ